MLSAQLPWGQSEQVNGSELTDIEYLLCGIPVHFKIFIARQRGVMVLMKGELRI